MVIKSQCSSNTITNAHNKFHKNVLSMRKKNCFDLKVGYCPKLSEDAKNFQYKAQQFKALKCPLQL